MVAPPAGWWGEESGECAHALPMHPSVVPGLPSSHADGVQVLPAANPS
jgi:hypothetical protein